MNTDEHDLEILRDRLEQVRRAIRMEEQYARDLVREINDIKSRQHAASATASETIE